MKSWFLFLLNYWFWILLVVALAFPIGVIFYGRKKHLPPHKHAWLKEIVVPVMTSLVVAVLGICFTVESARRQHADTESDRQTSLMRELIISQDRRDTNHILALDHQLNIRLQRYMEKQKQGQDTAFEEEAAFFFYSKHRAALVNLRSTAGNLVFRRLWMQDVFEQLALRVVECILGGKESDSKVSAEGESAAYKLFGGRVLGGRAQSMPVTSEQANAQGAQSMVLADFDRLINDRSNAFDPSDLDVVRIKQEFQTFKKRLQEPDPTAAIDTHELIDLLLAMRGLVAYSYDNLFSAWYGLSSEEIPIHVKDLGSAAPEHFLETIPYDFETSAPKEQRQQHWEKERQDAWKLIRKFCHQEKP